MPQASGPRPPVEAWGSMEGVNVAQKKKALHGQAKSTLIADLLYFHVIDMDRFKSTGRIAPGNSLRHKKCRSAFTEKFCNLGPRFFTKSAVHNAARVLVSKYGLEEHIPKIPGLPEADWYRTQGKSLRYLLRRVVKNCWNRQHALNRKGSESLPGAMDDEETQLYNWEDEDSCVALPQVCA